MLASYHGHAEAVRLLLRHGADANRPNDRGQTPLAGTAFQGRDGGRAGASGRRRVGGRGRARRAHGADDGRHVRPVEMVELLLAFGADRNRKTPEGLDALGAARTMGARNTPALLTPEA